MAAIIMYVLGRLSKPADRIKIHETIPQLAAVTKGVIAYEGMAKSSTFDSLYTNLKAPVAQGDGPKWVPRKNPEESQFSIYGSGHAGIFGSIIRATNVPGILQLNLLATDFNHDKAYPSYLYYNPYIETKSVLMNIEKGQAMDLYNTVSGSFIARNVSSSTQIEITSQQAAVIVCVPTGGKATYEGKKCW